MTNNTNMVNTDVSKPNNFLMLVGWSSVVWDSMKRTVRGTGFVLHVQSPGSNNYHQKERRKKESGERREINKGMASSHHIHTDFWNIHTTCEICQIFWQSTKFKMKWVIPCSARLICSSQIACTLDTLLIMCLFVLQCFLSFLSSLLRKHGPLYLKKGERR